MAGHLSFLLWTVPLSLLCCSACLSSVTEAKTTLCTAVAGGQLKLVKHVLATGGKTADINKKCDFLNTNTPLSLAAQMGHLAVGEYLIAKGAKVNAAAIFGYTPLLRAAEGLHPEFLRLLLEKKADMKARLLPMKGININIGLDVLSMAAAAYLREYPFMNATERKGLSVTLHKIIKVLFAYCFDFKVQGKVAQGRLMSENHVAEANYILKKSNQAQGKCKQG